MVEKEPLTLHYNKHFICVLTTQLLAEERFDGKSICMSFILAGQTDPHLTLRAAHHFGR